MAVQYGQDLFGTPINQQLGATFQQPYTPQPVSQSAVDIANQWNLQNGYGPIQGSVPSQGVRDQFLNSWDASPSGGGGGQVLGTNTQQAAPGPNIPSMEDQLRSQISSAWDSYTNSLNDTSNTFLPQQRTAQENIANTQLTAGQNTINSQKASSLRDIANNTKNAFQAGNIYLGARGAGDSSAANQYSFAVGQEANKQGSQLNEFVNTQLNNLQSTHDTQIQQIAQWFSEQQQRIKEMVAQGQLSKSQDLNNLSMNILNNAISAANQVKADTSARYNALVGWAANNSQNLGQLQSNIAGIPQAMGAINVDASGNIAQAPFGQALATKKNSLFG